MKSLISASFLCGATIVSAAAAPAPAGAAFFESKVRPLLVEHCFKCHSHDAEKIKGGLVLDSRAGVLQGGDTGPAIVPGQPGQSLLIKAVSGADKDLQMPPKTKLASAEVETLRQWVKMGAPWSGTGSQTSTPKRAAGKITDEDRQWWAFQPVKPVAVPAIRNPQSAIRNDIDRFILAKLADAGLQPSPEADRVTLARRVYFDLVGLPPKPTEIDEFVNDRSADAYEKLVDRLLASPRHGEKWARHWLDLVRFAESDGYKADDFRPHAWRFRDYVVKAFNDDKPYHRFVQEQLAADELFADNPDALAGTAYFRAGIYEYNNRDVRGQWQRILEDITDTTADAFLGMGLQCARCHDHKFDPILQKDYYRFQAFFAPLLPRDDLTLATPAERAGHAVKLKQWNEATADIHTEITKLLASVKRNTEKSAIEKFIEDIRVMMNKPPGERTPYEHQIAELAYRQVIYDIERLDTKLKGEAKDRVLALRKKLTEFDALKPAPLPTLIAATDVGPVAPAVFIPKKESLGAIPAGFPTVLDEKPATVKPFATSTGRRAALAQWLTQPSNPLTARVMVNRLWQWHFGRGLAANASDFGKLGEKPSHPELLDWLAERFVAEGWSLKKLHRLIVTSATYRQRSQTGAGEGGRKGEREIAAPAPSHPLTLSTAHLKDPENRLLWRFPSRRLEAEQIRDAILSVTGELKLEPVGGPSTDALTPRRTIYSKILRNARDPILDVFDLAESFNSVAQRNTTTTPTQALLLFNSQMMLRHARAFASRLDQEFPSSDDEMIGAAYRLAFGREPRAAEKAAALKFVGEQMKRIGAAEAAASAKPFAAEKMPYRDGVAAVVTPEIGSETLLVPDSPTLPKADFTIEAAILVRTVDKGGTVRTIAAKWAGDNKKPGWGFAVTGDGSRRKPRTLVMQFIGTKLDGSFGEDAIFSDQTLELGRPYFVAASVRLATNKEPGEVTFYVKDLANDDEPISIVNVPHSITGGFANTLSLQIGGRAARSGGFDGMIDDVRLSTGALKQDELLLSHDAATDKTAGFWQFESRPNAFKDSSASGNDIRPPAAAAKAAANARTAALADFCHALLNANEFVYVD
ncbi:MAG: DUF1553 domain-containing protein [Verrucomicrobia bacterium]|nr:DUF1553 domain-containing protein [Verrucomicrobiota bacterium]